MLLKINITRIYVIYLISMWQYVLLYEKTTLNNGSKLI